MPGKIGIILIATGGDQYTRFLSPLRQSIIDYMPDSDTILFTDDCQFKYLFAKTVYQTNLGWPRATLMRYHSMVKQEELLKQYSHVFYMDVDMLVASKIEHNEICGDGITATLHPGYVETYERNPRSTAFVEDSEHNYYQGCFVGGETNAFLKMAKTIAANVDKDDGEGVMAIYHDESHLNRYLIDNPPVKILSPAYCFPGPAHVRYPERWIQKPYCLATYVPKIRHLEKPDQARWKNK